MPLHSLAQLPNISVGIPSKGKGSREAHGSVTQLALNALPRSIQALVVSEVPAFLITQVTLGGVCWKQTIQELSYTFLGRDTCTHVTGCVVVAQIGMVCHVADT